MEVLRVQQYSQLLCEAATLIDRRPRHSGGFFLWNEFTSLTKILRTFYSKVMSGLV